MCELDPIAVAVAIQHRELAPARHLGDGVQAVNPVQCYDIAIRRFIDGIDAHAQCRRKKIRPPEHIGLSGPQGRISGKSNLRVSASGNRLRKRIRLVRDLSVIGFIIPGRVAR